MSRELPPGWTVAKFAEIASIASDLVDPRSMPEAIHLAPDNIESWTANISGLQTVSEAGVTSPKHRFRKNQIVYSKIRPYLAKATIPDFDGLCSADMYPIDAHIDAKYLLRYMLTKTFVDQTTGHEGRTVLPKINQDGLNQTTVPVPPLPEQHRIVERIEALLAKGARATAALDVLPALLNRYQQSLLAAAFRGDLTAEWRASHGSSQGDGKRPIGWTETNLEALIIDGPANGYSPKSGEEATGTLSLKLTATTRGKLDLSPGATKRIYETIPAGSKYWLRPGDILVQRANSIEHVGATAIYDGPPDTYIYPDLMMRFRVSDPSLARYLWRLLNSPEVRKYFRDRATGTSGNMPKISSAVLKEVVVPLPPSDEITEITRRLDAAEAKISRVLASVKALTSRHATLIQSILAKAFQGELVPQDPTDEPASALLERIRITGGLPSRRRTPPKATRPSMPAKENIMSNKMRSDVGPTYLADLLKAQNQNSMRADRLYILSGMLIDEFYKQLANEIALSNLKVGAGKDIIEIVK